MFLDAFSCHVDHAAVQDMTAKATYFIIMLKQWIEENSSQPSQVYDIATYARDTNLVSFLATSLLFCRKKNDTYAERFKVSHPISQSAPAQHS